MTQLNSQQFEQSLLKSFYDDGIEAESQYTSRVICNSDEEKFGDALTKELRNCKHFDISVAFITEGGFQVLVETLMQLDRKEISGRVLTTDYLNFTNPKALLRLQEFENIEVRLYETDLQSDNTGFHTKGYIFKDRQDDELYRVVIGSSNLTGPALSKNKEWNMLFVSRSQGSVLKRVQTEFDVLWKKASRLGDALQRYEKRFEFASQMREKSNRLLKRLQTNPFHSFDRIEPNVMQREFIDNLKRMVVDDKKRALLVAATGTGKTYAAALALREIGAEKILFIVHREQIARKALESFQQVFGDDFQGGIYSGADKQIEAKAVFATMQTLSKPEQLAKFPKDRFTHIVVDEAHHIGAESYKRISDYFEPELWLGMTATPYRLDEFNVFDAFDNNIAYNITLQKALESEFLCPFHYYGISDVYLENTKDPSQLLDHLTTDERVDHILTASERYGFSGKRVKGLIFCSRLDECRQLAEKFIARGKRVKVLSGKDSQVVREEAIARLQTDENCEEQLDYILTIDVFNEGVDIPSVNQIILLRPTESPIVFVQQLGRGLRLAAKKEFLVVLDFIANYKTNYMIPIALTGDRSYNKDNMRRRVSSKNVFIAGSSTVEFDRIAKERILASIDKINTGSITFINESYKQLKYELGRIPKLMDFETLEGIDPLKIFAACGSYHAYLQKYEEDYLVRLTKAQEQFLTRLSRTYGAGKRALDLLILKQLLTLRIEININRPLSQAYMDQYRIKVTPSKVKVILSQMNHTFAKIFGSEDFFQVIDERISIPTRILANFKEDFAEQVEEVIDFSLQRNLKKWSETYQDTDFVLNEKYSYEDVSRLLNWDKPLNGGVIGGYKYDEKTQTIPVFVNYQKDDNAIAYHDHFVDPETFVAISKNNRSINSPDADRFFKRGEKYKNNRIYLFVRKNKKDDPTKEFYFLGEVQAQGEPQADTMDGKNVFKVQYRLESRVQRDLYDYIVDAQ